MGSAKPQRTGVRRGCSGGVFTWPDPGNRCVIPLAPCDLKNWLTLWTVSPKFYWQSREGDCEVAAIGRLATASSSGQLEDLSAAWLHPSRGCAGDELSRSGMAPRLYGGVGFDAFQSSPVVDSAWAAYGRMYWFVPVAELRREGANYCLIINDAVQYERLPRSKPVSDGMLSNDTERAEWVEQWLEENQAWMANRLRHHVTQAQWTARVNEALKLVTRAEIKKVVLSRSSSAVVPDGPHGLEWISYWSGRNPGCSPFYFQPVAGDHFFGCTPERLYKRDHSVLLTEALASTTRRCENRAQDQQMAQNMATHPKTMLENELVVQMLDEALAKLSVHHRLCSGTYELVRLKGIQHLKKSFEARLRPEVADSDIIQTLHPTPAVSGLPLERAIPWIDRLDQYDRGWYTGALGYLGEAQSELMVSLRCARQVGNRLTFFTGAGIVPGSAPELEWQELNHKLASLLPSGCLDARMVSGYVPAAG